jgi:hypothetical protein
VFAVALALGSEDTMQDSSEIFSLGFFVVWFGAVAVTVNAILLGGTLSFFQTVCLLGYCMAPMALACVLALFSDNLFYKSVVAAAAFIWSTRSSIGFFGTTVCDERKMLAVYPVMLYFVVCGWLVVCG